MPKHVEPPLLVDANVLSQRVLAVTRRQSPGTAIDALMMAAAAHIVVMLKGQDPSLAGRFATECGRILRDAVQAEMRSQAEARASAEETP